MGWDTVLCHVLFDLRWGSTVCYHVGNISTLIGGRGERRACAPIVIVYLCTRRGLPCLQCFRHWILLVYRKRYHSSLAGQTFTRSIRWKPRSALFRPRCISARGESSPHAKAHSPRAEMHSPRDSPRAELVLSVRRVVLVSACGEPASHTPGEPANFAYTVR